MTFISPRRLRVCLSLCLLLAATAFTSSAFSAIDPLNIVSEQGNFSIALPQGFKHPELSITPIATEVGQITTVNYISYSSSGACMVGMSEYPERLVSLIKMRQVEVLKGAQEGALRNMDATLLKQEDFSYKSHPGRKLWFESQADGQRLYGQMQLISALPRLYHILFLTDREDLLHTAEVNGYFKSFQLLN